ncbi:family 16 glycosylhydrolase [Belnapia sp. T18]|uniref:Family 16 glycosylhydrolase n=1 Tax=Belnapia arida TaxID=2804533 RepID=A0ABS1U7T3_9PROT|nr:family 16 glycosylhydrolase [Belnapia arida]MBL6080019.1 family 16 glycosylhydrolase [Belnapia arida]
MQQISSTRSIFRDDFNTDGSLSAADWSFPTGDPSFLGNTQIRASLPVAQGGNAILRLDTHNPTGRPDQPTYFGTAGFTKEAFGFDTSNSPNGIAFEARARLGPNDADGRPANPSGLIAGIFPFVALPNGRHDEIDVEWIPKRSQDPSDPNLIQTNVYQDDPYDDGVFQIDPVPDSGNLSEFHVYRIEWLPNQVRWLVDGTLIRTETGVVPTQPMQLWMNIWGPPSSWSQVSDYGNLPPVSQATQNQTRLLEVDYVSVEALSAFVGTGSSDRLVGTSLNDHVRGLSGSDRILGRDGNDSLDGGYGDDRLLGGGGADRLLGQQGADTLRGGNGDDHLDGGSGADQVIGGRGADTLTGGRDHDHDLLTGSAGADRFVFGGAIGRDVVTDFTPGEDRIDLTATNIHSFASLASVARQAGPDLLLRVAPGEVIVLRDVQLDALSGCDFLFA